MDDPKNHLKIDPAAKYKNIKTYGLEFVLVGILGFVTLILTTIGSYRIFIMDRVKASDEFKTASYFVSHSPTLKKHFKQPLNSIKFKDIEVTERENFGMAQVIYDLKLKNNEAHELEVATVKVADYWIVYEVMLDPGSKNETFLLSTYYKILRFLESLDFRELEQAEAILQMIQAESRDGNLSEFLTASLEATKGNQAYALQILTDLLQRVHFSQMAVQYEIALIHYQNEDYEKTIQELGKIENLYQSYQKEKKEKAIQSLFAALPKDPFLATLEPDNVWASSLKLFSLSHYNSKRYEDALAFADKAIEQAEKIKSSVVKNGSIYLRGLNLYYLERFEEAKKEFTTVISDPDNPNLLQKSWAYFFKAKIAAKEGFHADSLDYFEMAVNLEPTNDLVRQGAIDYLLERNFVGDFEIALGYALRGIDYGQNRGVFLDYASRIYKKLGLRDKTKLIQ